MSIRKINYRLHNFFDKVFKKPSYVDTNAITHKSNKIIESEIHGEIVLGERSVIFRSIISGNVSIGSNTTIWGPNIQILSVKNPITIGNFCSIARDVSIQEYFHDYKKLTTYYIGRNIFGHDVKNEVVSKGPIVIGNDVWIGTGVQIMSGVTIGDGAVIAANSTVTHNVLPYAVMAGVPARILKYRFSQEIIEELLRIKWWDWSIDKIKDNKQLFSENLSLDTLKKNINSNNYRE